MKIITFGLIVILLLSGIEQVAASVGLAGNVIGHSANEVHLTSITVYLALPAGGSPADLTTLRLSFANLRGYWDGLSYSEETTGDQDDLLEDGEIATIYVTLTGDQLTGTNELFTLEIKPLTGGTLTIERRVPAAVDTNMDLDSSSSVSATPTPVLVEVTPTPVPIEVTPTPTPMQPPTPTPTVPPVIATPTPIPYYYSTPTPIVTPTVTPTVKPTPTPTKAPIGKPQLTISQTTLREEPEVGEDVLITVTISNTGNEIAKNINLREHIPSSVSINFVDGANSAGNLITWSGDLYAGQTYSIMHSFRILEERNKAVPVKVTYEDENGKKYETSAAIYISAKAEEIPAQTLIPGFEAVFAIAGLLAVVYLIRIIRRSP